jgi:molecular chaperone DnaK
MDIAVGIDLGTTNSGVAHLDEHGQPRLIRNDVGKTVTPSVICFQDGAEPLVGEAAKELQATGLFPTAAFFKLQMGSRNWAFPAGGRTYTAVELSAIVLRTLKAQAEAALGQEVRDAVLTVPAYFRDPERKATAAAGEAAGFNILRLINEPTAAAVAHGFRRADETRRLLVYDLGGGTFDVTVLESGPNGVQVLTSDGDHQLGGRDWDQRLVQYLADEFDAQHGVNPLDDASAGDMNDLLVRAEQAKCRLSDTQRTLVSLIHDGIPARIELERASFEDLTADLMERTRTLTTHVLEDVRLSPGDVDGVLLVGGSTRMPMVRQFVTELFGKPSMTGVNVDEVVALGAAVVAQDALAATRPTAPTFALPGVAIRDVTNHSLGMLAINEDATRYVNSVLLPKNQPLPCQESRPYQYRTSKRGPNDLEVFVTQGESDDPGDVAFLDLHVIHGVPPQPGGVTVVDITYSYDVSAKVEVSARVRGTGEHLRRSTSALPVDVPDRFLQPPEVKTRPQHTTAYLAVDLSGSMSGAPLMKAQKAAKEFLKQIDLAHFSLGVIAFSDKARTKQEATQNARHFHAAVDGLTCGETGYGNATQPFEEGHRLLAGVDGARFLLVLTDGVWSRQKHAIGLAEACHDDDIEVIAIGFGTADEDFLKRIASTDEASFLTSEDGLMETFSTIAQEFTEGGGGIVKEKTGGSRGFLGGLLRRK